MNKLYIKLFKNNKGEVKNEEQRKICKRTIKRSVRRK